VNINEIKNYKNQDEKFDYKKSRIIDKLKNRKAVASHYQFKELLHVWHCCSGIQPQYRSSFGPRPPAARIPGL
jgi:hypothetical protein